MSKLCQESSGCFSYAYILAVAFAPAFSAEVGPLKRTGPSPSLPTSEANKTERFKWVF